MVENMMYSPYNWVKVRDMMSNATFNNSSVILCRSVLLVEETGVSGENHRPAAIHWQTLSHIFMMDSILTQRYSWNTAKVGVKHQSINQSINVWILWWPLKHCFLEYMWCSSMIKLWVLIPLMKMCDKVCQWIEVVIIKFIHWLIDWLIGV
jgi:hypothetical protein